MNIKTVLLGLITTMALAFALVSPVSAMCIKGCTLEADYQVGSIGAGAGANGVLGGTIKKRFNESGSGTVNEADLTVKIDKNGIKKIDGEFRSAGYGYNENMVQSTHNGTVGTGSISGSGTIGGIRAKIDIKKN